MLLARRFLLRCGRPQRLTTRCLSTSSDVSSGTSGDTFTTPSCSIEKLDARFSLVGEQLAEQQQADAARCAETMQRLGIAAFIPSSAARIFDILLTSNGPERFNRVFEQLLHGNESAFEALAQAWRAHSIDNLVKNGAIDATLGEILTRSAARARPCLLDANEPPDSKVLLCNTIRLGHGLSFMGRLHYLAVVRYTPSTADAARGLQPMLCTYVADAHGQGNALCDWLTVAMEPQGPKLTRNLTLTLTLTLTREPANPRTRAPAHPLNHSHSHALTRSHAYPLTRSPAHAHAHAHAHALAHLTLTPTLTLTSTPTLGTEADELHALRHDLGEEMFELLMARMQPDSARVNALNPLRWRLFDVNCTRLHTRTITGTRPICV